MRPWGRVARVTGAARVANIGPAGRKRRVLLGVGFLAAGVALLALLWWAGHDRGLRLAVFPLFWIGALGLFQARGHT